MGIIHKTSLVLLVQNPYTIFGYFSIGPSAVKDFEGKYGFNSWNLSKPVIKVYSIESGEAKEIKTILLDLKSDNRYINIEKDNLNLFLKLGRLLPDDRFISISVSNTVKTGRGNESVEDWEFFRKLGPVSSTVK